MKKLLSFLLALLLLASTAGAVDLYVDTDLIETDTPPSIVDGRTLVPVRVIFEAIGAAVEWDGTSRTATGVRGGVTVSIQIDNTTAYINGEPCVLDVPAQLINGRTMVPARFISEAMGCEVTWDGATSTAAVACALKGISLYTAPAEEHYHYDSSCNGGTYYETPLAEVDGRKLTPCGKCVLTDSEPPAVPETPASPAAVPGEPVEPGAAVPSGSNEVKKSGTYVGSLNSDKYHNPSCRYAKTIKPENEIWFDTVSEAQAQGYSPCSACRPR